MRNAKINQHALNEMFQNAHIAMQSISNLSPEVEDSDMKEEILFEYDEYQKFIGELSRYMEENGLKREDVGVMKKAMLWGSIKMKTLTGADKSKVADMLIKGATMGITELTSLKNDGKLEPEVDEYLNKLLEIEESSVERLKRFL
jgi:hypothetical protein